MKDPAVRTFRRGIALGIVLSLAGCETARSLVAIPFDMAKYVAVKSVEVPYDAAKMGAQGLVDAASSIGR